MARRVAPPQININEDTTCYAPSPRSPRAVRPESVDGYFDVEEEYPLARPFDIASHVESEGGKESKTHCFPCVGSRSI